MLAEFARTLASDYSAQHVLHHLVQRTIDILPITGAGVMTAHGHEELRFIAAGDEVIKTPEILQNELHQGPCWDAYWTGAAVSSPALNGDRRYPGFSTRAAEKGLAAVFTFPMRLNGACVGTLDLYRRTPGPLAAWDMRAGQVLADVAAAYLYNAQSQRSHHLAAVLFLDLDHF